MKQILKGYWLGALTVLLLTGGVALAKSYTDYIEVTYDNIKVYKDNVLCELKDGNGGVIEPFICNGTTYMPVRGTANLADMEVTWDGATKSVYLWDNMVPNGTYLMEVTPPYETKNCSEYLQQKGKSFEMSGQKYSNGFVLNYAGGYAMFNLNSKYSNVEFTVGHVDGSDMYTDEEQDIYFYVDGKLVKEISIGCEDMPKTVSIPVNYGLQLKVFKGENAYRADAGFGNITVR